MQDDQHENELQSHQDGRVYPLGRALRSTYDADNHDTLGSDVTGLMIDLSKIPYDDQPSTILPPPPAVQPLTPSAAAGTPRSWADRLGGWFGRRPAV